MKHIEYPNKQNADLEIKYQEARFFYENNVKDEEMKLIAQEMNFPYHSRRDAEKWLDDEENLTPSFIMKYKDNISVLAYINQANLKKLLNK